jgi:hypothetical protein
MIHTGPKNSRSCRVMLRSPFRGNVAMRTLRSFGSDLTAVAKHWGNPMNAIEIVATREIPAYGGALSPLELGNPLNPVSCLAAAHAAVVDCLLAVQLARQVTDMRAEAHWGGQVSRVLAQVAARNGGYVASDGIEFSGSSAEMSAANLTLVRTVI